MIFMYNFKPAFVPALLSGAKPHTIRKFREDGRDPLPGDELHLYTGLGTKRARLIMKVICEYAIEVTMYEAPECAPQIMLGQKFLTIDEIDALAKKDGFKDAKAFLDFFDRNWQKPYHGWLIGWEPNLVHEEIEH